MTPAITLITTCKGRLDHLRQTLPSMVAQADAECVVVDYGCPQGTARWVEDNFPGVTVVRVDDDVAFNQSRARNFGAVAARSPIFCFVDADIVLDPQFGAWVRRHCSAKVFLRAQPVTMDTWGSFVCRREDFWDTGGYDETYQGYGASPEDLYLRLAGNGAQESSFPATLISSISHGDGERTAFYPSTNRWWQHRINSLYLIAKLDVMKVLGEDLTREQREALYAQAKRAIEHAIDSSATSANLEVALEDRTTRTMNLLVRLGRKLNYTISWPAQLP